MFTLLFILWIIFNGRITFEIVIIGLIITTAVYTFVCKYLNFSFKQDIILMKTIPKLVKYATLLIKEIFIANIHVMKLILSQKYLIEPTLVCFKTKLDSDVERALLADSITLTPGTITVSVEDDMFTVHCLDSEMTKGLENSNFEQLILELREVQ